MSHRVSDERLAELASGHESDVSSMADELRSFRSAADPAVIAWIKQLLGSIAYRNETNRGPAIAMLDGLLTARGAKP